MIRYKGLKIKTCNNVYIPAEDTFLLADNLIIRTGDKVLEIGTGTGLVAIYASKIAKDVVATDINPWAVKCAKDNVELNQIHNVKVRCGNLFFPLKNQKFDLILFNTPYLPTEEYEKIDDDLNAAWDGGADGRKIIDLFLENVKDHLKEDGRVQLVQSSLSNVEKTVNKLEDKGFETVITASKKLFFEEIIVITGYMKK
ncbi:MAG: class I SAM-dependent methyltransferase [Methanobacteriaceae archaeon]|nr:class I SAM-dependent methyltransferase [Methanobacteriaceae archaeon]